VHRHLVGFLFKLVRSALLFHSLRKSKNFQVLGLAEALEVSSHFSNECGMTFVEMIKLSQVFLFLS